LHDFFLDLNLTERHGEHAMPDGISVMSATVVCVSGCFQG
jgi:hypothetical protein